MELIIVHVSGRLGNGGLSDLHCAEEGVKDAAGSEEDFWTVMEVVSENAEPSHHPVPVVAGHKLTVLLHLHMCVRERERERQRERERERVNYYLP